MDSLALKIGLGTLALGGLAIFLKALAENYTVVPTWIAGTNSVDLKVTPVITGTATTTTAFVNLETLGPATGAITCN